MSSVSIKFSVSSHIKSPIFKSLDKLSGDMYKEKEKNCFGYTDTNRYYRLFLCKIKSNIILGVS